MVNASSPASSGPAGSQFEGQVGAHYLLSLLAGTEPRGLPGTSIDTVQFQRAAEGHPLDDVIVHAHDESGHNAVLEIQVKRSITFSPSDAVFRGVVSQIADAARRPDFETTRYQLAIATARNSWKINGAYQEVLTWARQLGDAAIFMDRLARPGSANEDMRTFVETFRTHLDTADAPNDDETVWRLLRRLQILVFDFAALGSASEALAKERCIRVLHPDHAEHADSLWTNLIELALQIAASGGDRTREQLVTDLNQRSFRIAGERRFRTARRALAEASRHALADIDDSVSGARLNRYQKIAAVHTALDSGRFIEIRGDAGVGKSGVLKHFASQTATEANVIVLAHGRTIPNGWTAMRGVLGFDGTAHDLLSDLASDGAAILFLDNLDSFTESEQRTVVDLVREAATVPGISVVATARRSFGVDEPSWLPTDAIFELGYAEPVLIGELTDLEVEELRHAAPPLAPILATGHPARDVTRNLFRLARLVNHPAGDPIPRTEIDMADQWWESADGPRDHLHRDRSRVLRSLGEQALSQIDFLDVSESPALAVDALIQSETLRDHGNDKVSFQHDVLREWAIANVLVSDPSMIERLSFDRPVSAASQRGMELAARYRLEQSVDITEWQILLDRVSRADVHGSWRRAVLLALVRSEVANDLLTRAAGALLHDGARMLRELIRIIIAVDVQPASQVLAAAGFDPATIPASINAPVGPSWHRLIFWLLSLGGDLPPRAIPDVVDLYTSWSVGTIGVDPLTPALLQWLYQWLIEVEAAHHADLHHRRLAFGGELDHERIRSLESDLRMGFLLFCNQTPELAGRYLRSLRQYHRNEEIVRNILKFRGTLAQAAPEELAELTAATLISRPSRNDHYSRGELERPFGFLDNLFLPASPAQGPFFDLLVHAPQSGLVLIRRLVDHATSFYSGGEEYGDDSITISLPDGARVFPWQRSYAWSRDGSGAPCVTSALMALEAWAHRRIDAGEDFDTVLSDVLGSPPAPAAYLLVAVDLLLSHWPASRQSAVPFAACPELLCIDRERHVHDRIEYPDFFGLRELQKEPVGTASVGDLNNRASRRVTLEQLLYRFAFGPEDLRERLTRLLRDATARRGPPDSSSDLGDPRLMVTHAMNLADPSNWREVSVMQDDGTEAVAREYVPPETEQAHLAPLQEAARGSQLDANMQAALGLALDDPSRSSPELVLAAITWAQESAGSREHTEADADANWMREQALVTAAMILMRDGEDRLRAEHSGWAQHIFAEALRKDGDPVYRFRSGIRYNPIAIAFVGMAHALEDGASEQDLRNLLESAARDDSAAAHGFSAVANVLSSFDEQLPPAILRCAFQASVRPSRSRDTTEEEVEARGERLRQRLDAAIHSELAWLTGKGPEPNWPTFPSEPLRPRPRLRLPGGPRRAREAPAPQQVSPDERVDHQAAALWLSNCARLFDVTARPWLLQLTRQYGPWTATANGAGLEAHDEIDHEPSEWNHAYLLLLTHCIPGLTPPEIAELALGPIASLPDEPFFDIVTDLLRCIDSVFFNDQCIDEAVAVGIRSELSKRLMESNGWKRLAGSESASIEMHIGPAIGAFFFNDHGFTQPAKCYLLPKGIERVAPFLPVLADLVARGPSLFGAIVTLNLLEVAPNTAHLRFLVAATATWLEAFPNADAFWVDYGIGRRVCALMKNLRDQDPTILDSDETVQNRVGRLLTAMISLGIPDAARLEEALATRTQSGR